MRKEPIILLTQDTTELNYTNKAQTTGLGKLRLDTQAGFYLHPTIAITPERICSGILDT